MARYTFQTNANPLVNAWRVNCVASIVPERQCSVMVKSRGGAWRIPWTEEAGSLVHETAKNRSQLSD